MCPRPHDTHTPATATYGEQAPDEVHWLAGDGKRPPAQLVGRDHAQREVRLQTTNKQTEVSGRALIWTLIARQFIVIN